MCWHYRDQSKSLILIIHKGFSWNNHKHVIHHWMRNCLKFLNLVFLKVFTVKWKSNHAFSHKKEAATQLFNLFKCGRDNLHLQRWSSSSNGRSRGTSWCVCGLHSLGLAVGLCWRCLILWLHDADVIRQWASWSNLASWVPWQHNLYLDSQHTCQRCTKQQCRKYN